MRVLLLVSLFVLLILAPGTLAQRQAPPDALERMNDSIDALVSKVWPSVVQIVVTSYGPQEESNRRDANVVIGRQRAIGSGFVIDPEGYVITNAHVISGAERIEIILPPANLNEAIAAALSTKTIIHTAQVVGVASDLDIALLKVEGLKAPALPLAPYRNLRQGELVFAFGSPQGLRNTVTHGIVSAVAR